MYLLYLVNTNLILMIMRYNNRLIVYSGYIPLKIISASEPYKSVTMFYRFLSNAKRLMKHFTRAVDSKPSIFLDICTLLCQCHFVIPFHQIIAFQSTIVFNALHEPLHIAKLAKHTSLERLRYYVCTN